MKLNRMVTVFLDTDLRSYWYRNGGLASALYVSALLWRLPRTVVLKGKKVDHQQSQLF